MNQKFIFVTGGVVSSLGKGLTCASLGALLESRGLRVNICKIDPYLNVDPGTMSPTQHGEVFVTDDGAETDLDLGHYERFISIETKKLNNFTAGQVYETVIRNERKGEYLGGTVQVIPHVTDEIKSRIKAVSKGFDVCIGEIGGTVGDIEGLPFLEAVRQFPHDVGRENVLYIHLTLVPFIAAAGEIKTKPTQHSVKELTNLGIQPDIIILRSEEEVDEKSKEKISLFCNVDKGSVVSAPDVKSIYNLPVVLNSQGLDEQVCQKLGMWTKAPALSTWERINKALSSPSSGEVTISMVGKYMELQESYKSVSEALVHGGIANDVKVNIEYVDSAELEKGNVDKALKNTNGLLVPGGFGKRGGEGKVEAIRFARENKIPFFGICLGMHMAVVEFARNVAGLEGANSSEFDPKAKHLVVALMEEQEQVEDMGGSMRLGGYPCLLRKGSLVSKIYGAEEVRERHRHRWEFNNHYREQIENAGMLLVGMSPDDKLVEMIELKDHPWFVGVQFHPEFKSRPFAPHPLFQSFIKASMDK